MGRCSFGKHRYQKETPVLRLGFTGDERLLALALTAASRDFWQCITIFSADNCFTSAVPTN